MRRAMRAMKQEATMSIRRATLQDVVDHCDRLAQQGQRLRPDQRPIAALDADGTLWRAAVADLLWQRLIRERALDRRAGAPIARALRDCGGEPQRDPYLDYEQIARLHAKGVVSAPIMVRLMLAGLAGIREETLYHHSAEAVSSVSEL